MRGEWHGRDVAPVKVTFVLVLTGGVGYPWDSAVDSATDGALSSNRHGVVLGGTWNVPGLRAFGFVLPVAVGPYRIRGAAVRAGGGPGALEGARG